MANPSLSRQFTLTNFTWKLRANGHLNGEKIGAVNYLKLSRIPSNIRIYWNSTNNRDTAFSVDELVRGFKINERDEAGNAKTLDNVWLWSEGEIPIEPLSDIIEIEYNGAGDLIEPLLGNKSGAIDKIEKVQVVSAIDKILQPVKVVQQSNLQGYQIDDFYEMNANINKPLMKYFYLSLEDYIITNKFRNQATGAYNSNTRAKNNLYEGFLVTNLISHEILNERLCFQAVNADYEKGILTLNDEYALGVSLDYSASEVSASLFKTYTQILNEYYKNIYSVPSNKIAYYGVYSVFTNEQQLHPYGGINWDIAKPKVLQSQNIKELTDIKFERLETSSQAIKINAEVFANFLFESSTNLKLSSFIFKTKKIISFIAPVQDKLTYISLISKNTKEADFRITLIELLKQSNDDVFFYLGGQAGLKIPIKSGFELCFNNKKTGMDYAVIEIPAGDIYKIELELLNVYQDSIESE